MEPENNPLLPKTSVEIGGTNYRLGFTFGQLALAEMKLREAGIQADMLNRIFAERDAFTITVLFFTGLLLHHPNITYAEAVNMITFANMAKVMNAIESALVESLKGMVESSSKNAEAEN